MSRELIPRNFLENIWDFDDDLLSLFDTRSTSGLSSGLSVSDDEKHVYVEASVPGVDPDKIEVQAPVDFLQKFGRFTHSFCLSKEPGKPRAVLGTRIRRRSHITHCLLIRMYVGIR